MTFYVGSLAATRVKAHPSHSKKGKAFNVREHEDSRQQAHEHLKAFLVRQHEHVPVHRWVGGAEKWAVTTREVHTPPWTSRGYGGPSDTHMLMIVKAAGGLLQAVEWEGGKWKESGAPFDPKKHHFGPKAKH